MNYPDNVDRNIAKRAFAFLYSRFYNIFLKKTKKNSDIEFADESEREIYNKSLKNTDINDHLLTLYRESVKVEPKSIVELGVRGGESTFVFERVAEKFDAILVSVDIEDCSDISTYHNWHFVRADDIEFAKNFKNWCKNKGIKPEIDILFIDTSHVYEHTKEEIKHWFPYLSQKAKVFFHDTNLKFLFKRKDGSLVNGWDNKRGVIRAIEDFCGKKFDETKEFKDSCKNFEIIHYPFCAGLTILTKKSV